MIRRSGPQCPSCRERCRERESAHFKGTCLEERIGCGVERVAGRKNIVDQPNGSRPTELAIGRKCAPHILVPISAHQFGLGLRVTPALESVGRPRSLENGCDAAGNRIDVVEAALTSTASMERDTHDEVGSRPGFPLDSAGQFGREVVDREADRDRRAEGTPRGFEAGYPSPNGALVPKERTADMERAAFHEASGAAFGCISMRVESDSRRHPLLGSATRTTVDHPPPRQPAVAGGAERSGSIGKGRITFDTTRPCDRIQENRDSLHCEDHAPRRVLSFGTESGGVVGVQGVDGAIYAAGSAASFSLSASLCGEGFGSMPSISRSSRGASRHSRSRSYCKRVWGSKT